MSMYTENQSAYRRGTPVQRRTGNTDARVDLVDGPPRGEHNAPIAQDRTYHYNSTSRTRSGRQEPKESPYGGHDVVIRSRSLASLNMETPPASVEGATKKYTYELSHREQASRREGGRDSSDRRRLEDTFQESSSFVSAYRVPVHRPVSPASSASSYDPPPSIVPTRRRNSPVNIYDTDMIENGLRLDEDELRQFQTLSTPFAKPRSPVFAIRIAEPRSSRSRVHRGSSDSSTQSEHYPETPRTSHELVASSRATVLAPTFDEKDDYSSSVLSPARRIAMAYSSASIAQQAAQEAAAALVETKVVSLPKSAYDRPPQWQGFKNVNPIDRLRIKNFTPSIATTTRSNKSLVSMKGTSADPRVYIKVGDDGMVRWKIRKRRISRAPWEEDHELETIEELSRIKSKASTKYYESVTPVVVAQSPSLLPQSPHDSDYRFPSNPATSTTTTIRRSLDVPILFSPRRRTSTGSDRSGCSQYTDARTGSPPPSRPSSIVEDLPPQLEFMKQKTSAWALDTIASVGQRGSDARVERIAEEDERKYDRRIEKLNLGMTEDAGGFFGSHTGMPRSTSVENVSRVARVRDRSLPSVPSSSTLHDLSHRPRPSSIYRHTRHSSCYTPPRTPTPTPPPKSRSFTNFRLLDVLLFRKKSAPQLHVLPTPTRLSYNAPDKRASFKSSRTRENSWPTLYNHDAVDFGEKSFGGETEWNASNGGYSAEVKSLEDKFDSFRRDERERIRSISRRRSVVIV